MNRLKKFRKKCVACGSTDRAINKEHFWPKWLIKMTNTHSTHLRWGDCIIPNALSATVPLCSRCNSDFGAQLEGPVSKIFKDLEAGKGISDNEAELLIRWLWKIEGLVWSYSFPEGKYTEIYTLRERALRPIDKIRDSLILAIALAERIDYEDAAMGIDSKNERSAIFVAGVFSKIAIMVVDKVFEDYIPEKFSKYHLAAKPDAASNAKLFYPNVTFETDLDAVVITAASAAELSSLHDLLNEVFEEIAKEKKRRKR